ncbi:MAG TPA: glycosyltransferase [Thermomicrobiaceae bacterium]|nr:glycosyltransferase [Thermomicrobiaceae bacterium]
MRVLVVTNIYPTPDKPVFGTFVRTQVECLRRAGVEIDVMAMDGRFRKLIYPWGVVQLQQRLLRERYDLIHAFYSYSGMVARCQWKLPLVVTYEGADLTGAFSWNGRPDRSNAIVVPAGQLLARLADAAIVQSQEMADKIPNTNVHIVPHEVDFDTFQVTSREQARRQLGLEADKKYLLFAADPDNGRKNYALARAAAERLAAEDPSVELLVVWRESQERLALYMSACDALVFPSYSEGSPNVVKQALACNLPIVATEVGDIREVIAGTDWCYLAGFSADEFAMKLREILTVLPRTDGRLRARRYAPEVIVGQVRAIYDDVLARRERRSTRVVLDRGE